MAMDRLCDLCQAEHRLMVPRWSVREVRVTSPVPLRPQAMERLGFMRLLYQQGVEQTRLPMSGTVACQLPPRSRSPGVGALDRADIRFTFLPRPARTWCSVAGRLVKRKPDTCQAPDGGEGLDLCGEASGKLSLRDREFTGRLVSN
jgi:hypothetical protein